MNELLITLFLCGDVMLGRGVDQILPHSVDPVLFESHVKSAVEYVHLAERATGPIDEPVGFEYVWGDALGVLDRVEPAASIINLETAVTTSDDAWPGKGIHYRMHPANVPVLTAARIDVAVLANNHVLDWGLKGLAETVRTLQAAGIATVGAGADEDAAAAPAVVPVGEDGRRVLVFAYATRDSGVLPGWEAEENRPGVNALPRLTPWAVDAIAEHIEAHRRPGDVVVFSIHWGANWGYEIVEAQRTFAHRLIDEAGVDVVHGHSSHHVKAIEVYRNRPIFYGCGDFLNDYEGIAGHERYRPDLTLMYFPMLDAATGRLAALRLVPMQIRHLQLNEASDDDARWLRDTLNRESERFGVTFHLDRRGDLVAQWEASE